MRYSLWRQVVDEMMGKVARQHVMQVHREEKAELERQRQAEVCSPFPGVLSSRAASRTSHPPPLRRLQNARGRESMLQWSVSAS